MRTARWWAAAALAAFALPCSQSQEHPFSVKDDISMTRISDPRADPGVPGSGITWPSPDGSSVAVVTSRGILTSDTIESQILVFNLHAISDGLAHPGAPMPKPHVVASVRSVPTAIETDAYAPVIKDVRWSSDSSALYFRATNLLGNYQICRVKRDGRGFERLTPENRSVDRFDFEGTTVVYDAADPGSHLAASGTVINQDALDITGARLQDILFPNDVSSRADKLFRLYTLESRNGQSVTSEVPAYSLAEIPYLTALYPFRVSPRGKELIKLEPPAFVPEEWTRYTPTQGLEHLRIQHGNDPRLLRADNVLRPLEYTLIDLARGQRTPLLDAPNARSFGYSYDMNRVAWSKDGSRVLVTNTFLASNPGGRLGPGETYPCAVASVDLPSRISHCLESEKGVPDPEMPHVQDVAFGESADDALVLLHDGSGAQTLRRYHFRSGIWSLSATESVTEPAHTAADAIPAQGRGAHEVEVYVHQSLNEPPTLWARGADGAKRELWDPNPQFHLMEFGRASRYQWKDDSGREWSGIVVKPVGYIEGKRYPLVLQMYNYVDGQFITDGLYPTAFAARELASAGFVVLQIRKKRDTISEDDSKIHLEGYRSAIARLDEQGLIQPNKVGVVGFSWTCWYVAHAIVAEPKLFAAATIADGLDNSYMQYKLFTVGDYILERQMTKIRGGPPFGPWLKHWVEAAPGFHLDRVETPVRIEAIGHSSVLQEWELYASLHLQHKPVDLVYFPNGSHIHQLPLERLESQQGNVDWLRFWLKDEEDPDASKRAQYQRWEEFKEQRNAENQVDGPPVAFTSKPNS